MPCSCGNETCPCGIPCYCLEESCKCQDCALALHRFCNICNKPLITDIQTDKDACSCFVGESTALILENSDNIKYRLGNIPTPIGYFVYGKLIANVMIPVPVMQIPQFIIQQPIHLMPPTSMQKDSENILSSSISVLGGATPLNPTEEFCSPSTELHQLDKSSRKSSNCTSTSICSSSAQNTESSYNKTDPSFVLQSTDETKAAHMVPNAKSGTEVCAIAQETASLYLPSIRIDNISYPVGLADQVWSLPIPAFCVAGSPNYSLKLSNPFSVTGTARAMTNFEKECNQPVSSLNIDSNCLAQDDSVKILQKNEQLLNETKITGKSDLDIHGENERNEDSFTIATGRKFTGIPSLENLNGISSTEQLTFNSLGSNEIQRNYLMHDETSVAASNDISASEPQTIQSQPVYGVSSSSSRNDCLQDCPVNCNLEMSTSNGYTRQNNNVWCPPQNPVIQQNMPEYLKAPNVTSKFKTFFNEHRDQSSKENENPQSQNSRYAFINKKTEEIDSIPLYIDTSTTQKMEKLLKPVNLPTFTCFR